MHSIFQSYLCDELNAIADAGILKTERVITTPQRAIIHTTSGSEVINLCANNYLGLSSHPRVVEAAKKAMDTYGYGLSSVRFICGTQDIHKNLEKKIADFLGMEDAILYASAFDANGGLFEPLLQKEDVVISDELNHASIIDGIRLCKAKRYRYEHNNMDDLAIQLKKSSSEAKKIAIVTDGVFSMDGTIAQLDKICDLADQYNAWVITDECHALGFLGETGRGTPEYRHVTHRVNVVTGTLGKALGGALGGFTAGSKDLIALLRQRSRPYLFSNTLPPAVVGASIEVFDMLSSDASLREALHSNTAYFRSQMTKAGFDIKPGTHPIVPIMLYEAKTAQIFAQRLLERGIYVIGFFFPVVPKGKARIRVQVSAAHRRSHLDKAIDAFVQEGKALGVID